MTLRLSVLHLPVTACAVAFLCGNLLQTHDLGTWHGQCHALVTPVFGLPSSPDADYEAGELVPQGSPDC